MTNDRLKVAACAFLLVTLAGCDLIFGPRSGGNIAVGNLAPATCRVKLTIKELMGNQNQHLKVEQDIRLVGPDGTAGDYQLRPLGKPSAPAHHWIHANYDLINVSTTSPPTQFQVFVDVIAPGQHPVQNKHFYDVTMGYGDDGCPNRLEFDAAVDLDSSGSGDHGGHAIALR